MSIDLSVFIIAYALGLLLRNSSTVPGLSGRLAWWIMHDVFHAGRSFILYSAQRISRSGRLIGKYVAGPDHLCPAMVMCEDGAFEEIPFQVFFYLPSL
jgi:hypothetical protein